MSDASAEDDKPGHRQAATVAGLQFVLGIGLTLAVAFPVLIFIFVLLPMGWGAVWPTIIMVASIVLIGRVGWVMYRSPK